MPFCPVLPSRGSRLLPLSRGPRASRPFLSGTRGIAILPLQLQDWRAHGARTVLVIAHRLQTVQSADQVLVLRQGRLQGPEQLVDGQDLYSWLVQQNQSVETPDTPGPTQGHLSAPE